MDVTALMFSVLMLLAVTVQISCGQHDADFPLVRPNRLQFFQYESLSVNCEDFRGPTEWRVMRKLKESAQTSNFTWATSTRSRSIETVYAADSGEYWCEDGDGGTSSAVNITVTDGDVILHLPASPLAEGGNVSLRCQQKETSNLTAQFYRNGVQMKSSDEGDTTVLTVSKSDEGLYKCRVSGGGESAESWMTVRELQSVSVDRVPLWIHVTVLCLVQLLLVLGLFVCEKLTDKSDATQTIQPQKADKDPDVSTFILPHERVLYSSVCYRSVKVEA